MKRKPYPNNPMFSSKSLLYQTFSLAMEGTTIDKIRKYCKRIGSNGHGTILKILRSGQHRNIKWDLEEKNGKLKVKNIVNKR